VFISARTQHPDQDLAQACGVSRSVPDTIATEVKVYDSDPKISWQRGISENTNGLFRQHLPTGSELNGGTQEDLDAIG